MKQRYFALFAVLLLLISSLFAGCGKKREFEKEDPNKLTTVPETTMASEVKVEDVTDDPNEQPFLFYADIQMGMSIKEVKDRIGVDVPVKLIDDRKNMSVEFEGPFINYTNVKPVQFMFNRKTEKLEQYQFTCNTERDGAMPTDAISLFNLRYGTQIAHTTKYENHVWYSGGVYIMISVVDDNNYVITYTEKNYFKENFKEEYELYQKAKQSEQRKDKNG